MSSRIFVCGFIGVKGRFWRCGWCFIILRVGILCFLLGILLYFVMVGSFIIIELLVVVIIRFDILWLFVCMWFVYEVSVKKCVCEWGIFIKLNSFDFVSVVLFWLLIRV